MDNIINKKSSTGVNFVYKEEAKERLDKFLQAQLPDITRAQIKKAILSGQVLVNDNEPSVHRWLKTNDHISFDAKKKPSAPPNIKTEPKFIHQDKEYIILDKPAGLLVHPTDRGENNTLADWLVNKHPKLKKIGDDPNRPSIVHRLDKEVSGLMVIPLTQDSFDNIKQQFRDRTVKKTYMALVHGQVINNQGEITTALVRDKKTGLVKALSNNGDGRIAHTTYELVKKYINYSLLKVQIKTGRTHQIRAHLYSIGHSLVGDKLYKTKDIRKKKKVLDENILLQANYLSFKNLDGDKVEYKLELPDYFAKFLANAK